MLHQNDSGTMKAVPPLPAEECTPVDVQVAWSPEGLAISVEPVCVVGPVGRIRWTLEGAPAGASLEISFSAEAIAGFDGITASTGVTPAVEAKVKENRAEGEGAYTVVVHCPEAALVDEYIQPAQQTYDEPSQADDPSDTCETNGRIDFSGWPPPV